MKKMNERHFGLRIDADMLSKFHYVCRYVGRSANSQLVQLILKFIADYEKKYGKIELPEQNKK